MRRAYFFRWILLLTAIFLGGESYAQTNASVLLQLYAGLTITGIPGTNYTVQYSTQLGQGTNWQTLTNFALPYSPYLFVDTSAPATNQRFYRVLAPVTVHINIPAGMALVPAGSFVMGDSIDGESDAPTSIVTVSGFFMDTNLVTFALWNQVYQWAVANGYTFDGAGAGLGSNYPVQSITWYDAARWCNARAQMAGLTPVYYADAGLTQVFNSGDSAPYANFAVSSYRLPTEAEWEKASRGGVASQRFPLGNTISEAQANYYGDPLSGSFGYGYDLGPAGPNAMFDMGDGNYSDGYTSPVGYFPGNGFGLTDMTGNVNEWCWDYYGNYAGSQTNPTGPSSGFFRVYRGGSWVHFASYCRCAARNYTIPFLADDELGFRTVLPQ